MRHRGRLTLIRIFEELRGRGYDGGYDAVRRYARRWSKERGQSTAARECLMRAILTRILPHLRMLPSGWQLRRSLMDQH